MIKCFWFDFGMHWEFKRHWWFVDDTFVLGLWFSSGTCNLQNCYNWSERDSFRNKSESKIETSTDVSLKCLVNPGFLYWGLFTNFHNLTASKLQFHAVRDFLGSEILCGEKMSKESIKLQSFSHEKLPAFIKQMAIPNEALQRWIKLFYDRKTFSVSFINYWWP